MTELLTSAQMRAIEAAAIASGEVTGLDLMERAGRGVVGAIFAQWPELAPAAGERTGALPRTPGYLGTDEGRRAVVLCGPGNNGGDGFVVARLLKELGWAVEVFLYGDPERMPPDARMNYERWLQVGEVTVRRVHPSPLSDEGLHIPVLPDVLVDAVFGIGLNRPFRGVFTALTDEAVQRKMRAHRVRRVAIDLPSGLNADSGQGTGGAVLAADLTVTFHALKPAHVHPDGVKICGRVVLCDIGLGRFAEEAVQPL